MTLLGTLVPVVALRPDPPAPLVTAVFLMAGVVGVAGELARVAALQPRRAGLGTAALGELSPYLLSSLHDLNGEHHVTFVTSRRHNCKILPT